MRKTVLNEENYLSVFKLDLNCNILSKFALLTLIKKKKISDKVYNLRNF